MRDNGYIGRQMLEMQLPEIKRGNKGTQLKRTGR